MIFELILAIAMIVAIVRIADTDGQSPWIWGAIAFVILLASAMIPVPYLRELVAFVVAYGAMLGYKIVANR